ncbi:MAG: type II toxin-antitoxin system ParD family antitoxin [Devosia sp.]
MATMTVSLPDPMKEWIEEQVQSGGYSTASDYVRDAVRRDRERLEPRRVMTIEELREIIDASEASGISDRSMDDLFAEAMRRVEARRRG